MSVKMDGIKKAARDLMVEIYEFSRQIIEEKNGDIADYIRVSHEVLMQVIMQMIKFHIENVKETIEEMGIGKFEKYGG